MTPLCIQSQLSYNGFKRLKNASHSGSPSPSATFFYARNRTDCIASLLSGNWREATTARRCAAL